MIAWLRTLDPVTAVLIAGLATFDLGMLIAVAVGLRRSRRER